MQPTRFTAFIGSFSGPSYRLDLDHDVLYYERRGPRFSVEASESFGPTSQEWSALVARLDKIGARDWHGHYVPGRGVVHERHWHLDIEVGAFELTVSGEGAAPDGFQELLAALSALVHGRAFE